MKLEEIKELIDAEVIFGDEQLDLEIQFACGADLMSDVLAFSSGPCSLLLTGLTNPQVLRTIEMLDMSAVVFVRGKRPPKATIEVARRMNIPLLCTEFTMYEACGKLYGQGLLCSSQIGNLEK